MQTTHTGLDVGSSNLASAAELDSDELALQDKWHTKGTISKQSEKNCRCGWSLRFQRPRESGWPE
jgi:hypothetical protein